MLSFRTPPVDFPASKPGDDLKAHEFAFDENHRFRRVGDAEGAPSALDLMLHRHQKEIGRAHV